MEKKIQYQRCQRCNRILKNDLARERGYGNFCWKLHVAEVNKTRRPALYNLLFPASK